MSTADINAEIQRLEASAIVQLFVLDASALGGGLFRFFPGTAQLQQPISWQGAEYTPFPVEVKGFEFKGEGAPPRPALFFSNVLGTISALALGFDDLIGARLLRKRTFAKYLDGQPEANPTAAFPDDIFSIERKVNENKNSVEFELATAMDVDDVSLPKRNVLANLCVWTYRSAECSYAGDTVVADLNDTILGPPHGPVKVNRGQWNGGTTYHAGDFVWIYAIPPAKRYFYCFADNSGAGITGTAYQPTNAAFWHADICSKRVRGCELRFPLAPTGLPFGGFPATARLGD